MGRNSIAYWGNRYLLSMDEYPILNSVVRDSRWADKANEDDWLVNAVICSNYLEGIEIEIRDAWAVVSGGVSSDASYQGLISDFLMGYGNVMENLEVGLSEDYVRQVHYLLFRSSDAENAGMLKTISNWVEEGKEFTKPEDVTRRLGELFAWYSGEQSLFPERSNYEVLRSISRLKQGFINIHPFLDGNGRISRLLVQKELVRVGLPPVLFSGFRRRHYHNIMGFGYDVGKDEKTNLYLLGLLGKGVIKMAANRDFAAFGYVR